MVDLIMSFLLSPPFDEKWLFDLRFAFLIISFILSIAIIYLLFTNTWLERLFIEDWKEFFTWKAFGYKTAESEWRKIRERLNTNSEPEYKLALIEADNMLSDALKKMEYSGENIAGILDKLPSSVFPSVEGLKWAHCIHENIINDPDCRLGLNDAKNAISAYEKFFTDLEVL